MTVEDLTEWKPRDRAEEVNAARAVREHRRLDEFDLLVESLSVRERLLIEQAWSAAAEAARKALLARLDSPLAVTLDASAVAQAVKGWHDDPRVFNPPNWGRLYGDHYDPRVVGIVRRATQEAESIEAQQ